MPSHQENFGIAVVEALACGKRVLISDQVNIWREVLQENAAIVASDSLEGVIDLLNKNMLLTDSEKLLMQKNAKLTFEKYFSVKMASLRLKNAIE